VSRGLLRSSAAATAAQFVRVAAIAATHLALRRLVDRADWGLRDWTEALFLILATVRDLGVPSHVLRLRPMPLGNLLRVQLVWGGAIAALLVVAAPLVAEGFSTPRPDGALVVRGMALYLLLEGLASVPLTHFEAELRIERALPAELARTAVYCGTALALGAAGFGVWTFVVAMIVSQAVYCALLWRGARPSLALLQQPGATPGIVRAALPVGAIWLLAFAVTYADPMILGGRFSDAVVGGYMFAYVWAFFASRVLQQPFARALYPALVATRERPDEQLEAFRLATKLLLAIEVPAALGLALNAPLATRLLGGRDYADAAPLLALLAFAPLVDPLGRFGGELLIARHLERARVLSILLQLAALVGGGLWLSARYGPRGMAWANFLPLGAPVILWALWRSAPRGLGRLLADLVEVYLAPLVPFAPVLLVPVERPWLRLAASAAAASLALGWFWFRFGDRFRAFFRSPAATAAP
jgi:O-antigen/teichoic acid export membrane protein